MNEVSVSLPHKVSNGIAIVSSASVDSGLRADSQWLKRETLVEGELGHFQAWAGTEHVLTFLKGVS